jgi:hypothetical protein
MKRIASLSIFFAALIEFAIERARFDLWIVAVVAIVTLLRNIVGRRLHADGDSKKHAHNASASRGQFVISMTRLSTRSSRTAPLDESPCRRDTSNQTTL